MIQIAKPTLGNEELAAVRAVLESGWLTQGPKTLEFENAFKSKIGAPYACAVSNCTTALHLALRASGVQPGDMVITVSHSFIATANSIRHCGAEPLFVDIDPKTYNMSSASLGSFLTERCHRKNDQVFFKDADQLANGESPLKGMKNIGRVAAILVVHQIGMPADLKNIIQIAKEWRLPVVEDAACAIGSKIQLEKDKWDYIGQPHGDLACFSFHPRKILTTGEGGMITSKTQELDREFRLYRQHGMSLSDLERHGSQKVSFEQYTVTGFNYRMTDIQSAIGLEQLKRLDSIVDNRRKQAEFYKRELSSISSITLPEEPSYARSNWQSFGIRLKDQAKLNQVSFMQHLLDRKISTRPGIMNAHTEAPYKNGKWHLPESEAARKQVVVLPLHDAMSEDNLKYICQTIAEALS